MKKLSQLPIFLFTCGFLKFLIFFVQKFDNDIVLFQGLF